MQEAAVIFVGLVYAVLCLLVGGFAVLAGAMSRDSLHPKQRPPLMERHDIRKAADNAATETDNPMDIVYTWVDASDPEWRAQKQYWADKARGESSGARFPPIATQQKEKIELYWSMRSVALNAPWVRYVYVVTQRPQRPPWIDWQQPSCGLDSTESSDNTLDAVAEWQGLTLRLVHHDRILPRDCLPVFNSCAIETGLHHCPGLAERFIYFNDDTFVGRPLSPRMLFDSGTKGCKPFLRLDGFLVRFLLSCQPRAKRFGWAAIGDDLGLLEGPLAHQATPLTRTIMRDAEHCVDVRVRALWRATQRSRFRDSARNVAPVGLAMMLAYKHNKVRLLRHQDDSVRCALIPVYNQMWLSKMLLESRCDPRNRPHLFCINPDSSAGGKRLEQVYEQLVFPHLERLFGSK